MPRHDLYAIDMERERNCYSCRRFGHLVRNCRNRGIIGRERWLTYEGNKNNGQRRIENGQNNLNGNRDLIVLD